MYSKGAVIQIPFPFTDLSGNKIRPALVISNTQSGNDVVVVFITSQTKLKERHLVSILPDTGNGLKVASQIVCGKIATLDANIALGEMGEVSDTTLKKVDTELRKILNL